MRCVHREESNDHAFMGYTHALSAAAAILALLAFVPSLVTGALQTTNLYVIIMSALVFVGFSGVPDLDNTQSRTKSDLGVLGTFLSGVFRASAVAIQTVVRTPRDDANPNPHRGFWHTIPASLMVGGLLYLGTRLSGEISVAGVSLTYGGIIAYVVCFLAVDLMFSNVFKKFFDKIEKKSFLGEFTSLLVSVLIVVFLVRNIPSDVDFWWMGVAAAAGMIIHILGDAFTTAGVPLFFPFPIKGKLWWNVRILPIKAGGAFENYVFIPLFVLIIIVCSVKILYGIYA